METTTRETRSHTTIMTRRRTLGLLAGGLVALTLRHGTAQTRPAPPPITLTPVPPVVSPTPGGEQPTPSPVVVAPAPAPKKRKSRKPRKSRTKRH